MPLNDPTVITTDSVDQNFFFPKKLLSLKALASKTKDTEVEKHSA